MMCKITDQILSRPVVFDQKKKNVRMKMSLNRAFTVLMAVYKNDSPVLFDMALNSVFENTMQPQCVLLVVDGPIPQLLEDVITKYRQKAIFNVHYLPDNVGLANALNAGISKVETEWIVRADADDYNLPNRFEVLSHNMTSDIGLMGSFIQEVDKNNIKLGIRKVATTHSEILKFAKYRNPFNHMSVCYRTNAARAAGGYPNIFLKEDYALWATMLSQGVLSKNLDVVLVNATAGLDMYKRRGGLKYALAEIELQRHLLGVGIKSGFSALVHGSSRALAFLLPSSVRGFLYEKILRS